MTSNNSDLNAPLFNAVAGLAFNSVMVAVQTDDDSVEVVYVNQAFTDLTGYAANEAIGQSPGMLQGERTDPDVLKRLADDLKNGRTFHGTTINYKKDGSAFTIEWKVTPTQGEDGKHYLLAVQREV